MDHKEALKRATSILVARGEEYGDPATLFGNAAAIASITLQTPISPYHIVKIMDAVKQAREIVRPQTLDNHVDRINYTAFAAQFAYAEDPQLESDIKAMAAKLSPWPKQEVAEG
jgi:hypothetical protein